MTLTCGHVVLPAFQLHAAVAAVEQEKFEMQKKHTENIQKLLEDTSDRLTKMEAEYNTRSQATVSAQTVLSHVARTTASVNVVATNDRFNIKCLE